MSAPASKPAPKVSVIVPNYNHAPYLTQRLDSILAQTFTDFELIILDDCSSDHSQAVIAGYLGNPRARFFPNEKNSGSPFVQWNRGVQLARGEFIWIAESDDFAAPEFLATLLPVLAANPKLAMAYCQSWKVDAQGRPLGTFEYWTAPLDATRWRDGFAADGRTECAEYLLWRNTVPNASAVLFRRDAYLRAGGAPENMRLCGDWMMWARLALTGGIAFLPACLNYYREHAATVRGTTGTARWLDEKFQVQLLILRSCKLPPAARRQLAFEILNDLAGRVREAARPGPEFFRLLKHYSPLFLKTPLAAAWAVWHRLSLSFRRRKNLQN